MEIIPTRTKWRNWTLPSKASYISAWIGIIALLTTLFFSLRPSKPIISQKAIGSGNIQTVVSGKNSQVIIDNRSFTDSKRFITAAQRDVLINNLSSFLNVRMRYLAVGSDSEAISFSNQIREALEDSGWITEQDVITLDKFFHGVVLYGSEDPPSPAINTLSLYLKEFGFNPFLIKDSELPPNVFSIKIGAKQNKSINRDRH